MSDLISRQTAIDAFLTELTKRERKNLLHTWSTVEVKYFITDMLERLPSAQPEGIYYVKFSEEDYEKIAEQLRKIPIVLTLSEPEIIRCRDCKNFGGGTYCYERDGMWDENSFCSNAERKEGEEDE